MYKITKNPFTGAIDCVDKIDVVPVLHIPFDPANTDYQVYLKWLEEGNTPEPSDEPKE